MLNIEHLKLMRHQNTKKMSAQAHKQQRKQSDWCILFLNWAETQTLPWRLLYIFYASR